MLGSKRKRFFFRLLFFYASGFKPRQILSCSKSAKRQLYLGTVLKLFPDGSEVVFRMLDLGPSSSLTQILQDKYKKLPDSYLLDQRPIGVGSAACLIYEYLHEHRACGKCLRNQ